MLKRIVVLMLFVQFSYTQNPSEIFDKEKKEIWDLLSNKYYKNVKNDTIKLMASIL